MNLENVNIRTDLVSEKTQVHKKNLPDGVTLENNKVGNIEFETVTIKSKKAEEIIGKPEGTYITITTPPLSQSDTFTDDELTAISDKLKELVPKDGQVLVAGLGNKDITPDALGPFVSDLILATRHIDPKTAENIGLGGIRSVSSFKTGVLGQTGVESSEMLLALTEKIKPSAIIVIDALAARNTDRIGSTIQISTSGISPGSGVFNKRAEISKKTLGIDVISIGIPTVVDANTIAYDLLDDSDNETANKLKDKKEIFSPKGRMFMVTPKDIDLIIEKGAKVIALMINMALQQTLSKDDIVFLTT